MTLVEKIDAFLGYYVQGIGEANNLLRQARAALAPAVKCPHGCAAGVEGRFGEHGVTRWRCLKCDSRWLP